MGDGETRPVVVLLSGGINSTVAACRELEGTRLHFLYVQSDEVADSERAAARSVAQSLAGEYRCVSLGGEGVGADSAVLAGKSGWHPGRPDLGGWSPEWMLACLGLACDWAWQCGADTVRWGVSCAAHAGEPPEVAADRRAFVHAVRVAVELARPARRTVVVDTPWIDMPPEEVVRLGLRLGAPLHLTWSCRTSGRHPCGACDGCARRAATFEAVGMDDPQGAVARA